MSSEARDALAGQHPDRGRDADSPADIPARGWKDVLKRVWREAKDDGVPLLAGGVAFFALLAIVPGMVALLSVYGLLADPEDISEQVLDALEAAPAEVRELVEQQLTSIARSAGGAAVVGIVVGLALALWSASSGMAHLMEAINRAYDEDEERGFVRKRGLALLLTLGAILFITFALAIIAVVPQIAEALELGVIGTVVVFIVRWALLLVAMVVALAVLYKVAPDRDPPTWRWVSPGALVATVVWIAGSLLFSLYVSNFASYNETYGSLGAVVVMMLWLQLTALVVIYGAELNAETERQTLRDSTTGPDRELGDRGADAADTVGETSDR